MTVFLVTEFIGRQNQWDAKGPLSGRPLLDWEAIRALKRGGLQFGAHTKNHPVLTKLSPAAAEAAKDKPEKRDALVSV